MQQRVENKFVLDLVTTLRRDRFSARAWGRFFQRSWQMSWQTARENPALEGSWRRVTVLILCLMVLILIGDELMAGYSDALHLLPGFIFCVVWQQSDLFWHLGLNRSTRSGELLQSIGTANTFTMIRALGASYLLGRLVGGLTTPSSVALIIFLCGIVTDILDGYVARRTSTQSKLGQIADAEADFCLCLALTIVLLQNGVLPLWIGIVMVLRFVVPLVAALLSYIVFARTLRFGSTVWGKYAGVLQCGYFLLLLIPLPHFMVFSLLNELVVVAMICLLIIAPIAQFLANMKVRAGT